MLMSYALGARTWERHIDINYNDVGVSKYNPYQNKLILGSITFILQRKCMEIQIKKEGISNKQKLNI